MRSCIIFLGIILNLTLILFLTFNCSDDDGGDGDTDADADSDADGDSDTDADSDANVVCSTDSNEPQLRVKAFSINSPETLANPIIQSAINNSIDLDLLNWFFEAKNFTTNTFEMRTGTGKKVSDCTYSYDDVQENWINMTLNNETFTNTEGQYFEFTLYVYSASNPEEALVKLPLKYAKINATFSSDKQYIGTPGNPDDAQHWTTDGTIDGWVEVDEAKSIPIEQLGMSLCDVLAGGVSGMCDKTQSEWDVLPGTMPDNNTAGYYITAEIGAGPCKLN